METSPLELYETAYKLHYAENNIKDAVIYYQRLIKDFPDSNECGYAVIQLQKIKAHNVAENLSELTSSSSVKQSVSPLLIVALVVSLLALAAVLFSSVSLTKRIGKETERSALALNTMGKVVRGEYEDALSQIAKLKKMNLRDITPYELAADIYRKQKKYDAARKEYAMFFQMNPDLKPSVSEKKYMNYDEKNAAVKTKRNFVRQQPPPAKIPSPVIKKRRIRKKNRTAVKAPPPPPGKTKDKKGLFIVDPDSISYF
jgi:tetratricopeptide (TPR) repeat protein